MKIKQEIIDAKYSIEELTKEEFDTILFGLRKGLDFYWQYTMYSRNQLHEIQKREMDKIEIMLTYLANSTPSK